MEGVELEYIFAAIVFLWIAGLIISLLPRKKKGERK